MNDSLYLFFLSIFIYEFMNFINPKKILKSNIEIYKKLFKLFLSSKVSDFRKEKLVLNYSKSLFIISFYILSIIFFCLILMYIINILSNSFISFVFSILGVIQITATLVIYNLSKKLINAKL
jgi:hypothetical protein